MIKTFEPTNEPHVPSPKSQVPTDELHVPSPKSQVPTDELHVPRPKSQVPTDESHVTCPPSPVTCNESHVPTSMMRLALDEAKKAAARDEVPIGAIIAAGDRVVARAHNLTESLTDPTAHAEMQAITAACSTIGGKYLKECTIYVTVEPCPMCAAALRWAQIGAVVWGADDEKFGFSTISASLLHPKTTTERGVLGEECGTIMRDFFAKKR